MKNKIVLLFIAFFVVFSLSAQQEKMNVLFIASDDMSND